MQRKNDAYALKSLFDKIAESPYLVGRRPHPEGIMRLYQLYGVNPQFKEATDLILSNLFAAFPPSEDDKHDEDCSDPDCPVHGKGGLMEALDGATVIDVDDMPPGAKMALLSTLMEMAKKARGGDK